MGRVRRFGRSLCGRISDLWLHPPSVDVLQAIVLKHGRQLGTQPWTQPLEAVVQELLVWIQLVAVMGSRVLRDPGVPSLEQRRGMLVSDRGSRVGRILRAQLTTA